YSLRCILAYIYRCLNDYEQAYLFLKEAIDLNPKRPVAYFICGEMFFRQNKYDEAIDNLNMSINQKAKINNLYILLGNSYLLRDNLNLNTLNLLDKLLNLNKEDSLVLCYYGEILYNMTQYRKAISYFTKAYTIDPENIHNLNRRAITYYIIKEYDKVLSDLDKIIQLDPLNSSAYYLKSSTYYTKNDINNAKISFKKCAELLNPDNILAKIQSFHLEYLLNKNSSKDLNNILTKITKINQILNNRNIYESNLLHFVKCKIYIELKKYSETKLALNNIQNLAFISYFIQDHPDFRSYLYEVYVIYQKNFTYIGIVNKNDNELINVDEVGKYMYMYKEHGVYFVSNLTNLNGDLRQFKESDISSLSGKVISSKNENLCLDLPLINSKYNTYYICKMNVKKILSKDCFIKFIDRNYQEDYMLKHEDVSKLEGLGWIEYRISIRTSKLSIEINSIEMQIEYIRHDYYVNTITYIPDMSFMSYLLPDYHKFFSNVPETFKDKYFSRKEMENLLDLKYILNNL
ncbi:TPR-like protein, partial [Rhizophagus irregularis]